jgi:hypothetical protein
MKGSLAGMNGPLAGMSASQVRADRIAKTGTRKRPV